MCLSWTKKNVINWNIICFNCLKASDIQLALKNSLSRGEFLRYSLHIQGALKKGILKTTFYFFQVPCKYFYISGTNSKKKNNDCWIKITRWEKLFGYFITSDIFLYIMKSTNNLKLILFTRICYSFYTVRVARNLRKFQNFGPP